jgi:DNA-binding NarL/FixJ family response regulator
MTPASSDPNTVKIVLVEDEPLYRDLLRIALTQRPGIEVLAAYSDGDSALAAIPALQPDVAMLDIDLRSSMNGVQLGILLRKQLPDLGVVLLSNHGDPEFVASLPGEVLAGWSYLLKKSVNDVDVLGRAIAGAASKLTVLDPQLVAGMRNRHGGLLARLTPRQRDILELIAQGFNNAAIAERLILAEKSVENQINLLYQQLDIDRSTVAAIQPRVKAVLIYLEETRHQSSPPVTS